MADEARRGGGGRERRHLGLKLLFFLFSSLFLNVFFFCYLVLSRHQPPPGWARSAASEAEAVAAVECSGHGRAFLAGGGAPVCLCNACYSGDDCSQPLLHCSVDAHSEDPLFLEPYWLEHAGSSAIVLPGWHSMSDPAIGNDLVSTELERHVRLLHKAAGNAITNGKFILFGSGSTELLNALVYAISANSSSSPAANVIEYVSSPNDPDGLLKQSVLGRSSVISNRDYYWPHYSSVPAPADEDIMIFTISKISGHAGIRFGYVPSYELQCNFR